MAIMKGKNRKWGEYLLSINSSKPSIVENDEYYNSPTPDFSNTQGFWGFGG